MDEMNKDLKWTFKTFADSKLNLKKNW